MKQNKVEKFSAPDSETPSIPLKNPEGVKGKEEARGAEKHPGACAVVRVQREKVRSERKEDNRFEGEVGAGVLH